MLTTAVAHGLVLPQGGEADECDCPACRGTSQKAFSERERCEAKSEIDQMRNSLSTMFLV
jgi:hypothetical protein